MASLPRKAPVALAQREYYRTWKSSAAYDSIIGDESDAEASLPGGGVRLGACPAPLAERHGAVAEASTTSARKKRPG